MIKKLMACIREYKRPTLLTFLFIVGEVIIECLIPFITANLVNQMKADMEMKTGLYQRKSFRGLCQKPAARPF